MTQIKSPSFDYRALPLEIAADASALADAFLRFRHRTAGEIVALGQDFIRLKRVMAHGEWLAWITGACHASERTIQHYMSAASAFGGKPEAISHLTTTTTIALSAKATPQLVRDQVVHASELGVPMPDREVRHLIAAHRPPPKKKTVSPAPAIAEKTIRKGLRLLSKSSRADILAFLETLDTVPPQVYARALRVSLADV